MVISLSKELEAALTEAAREQGSAPEELAISVLREKFVRERRVLEPRDEWERRLLAAASDCGISLPDSALSSEGLYE